MGVVLSDVWPEAYSLERSRHLLLLNGCMTPYYECCVPPPSRLHLPQSWYGNLGASFPSLVLETHEESRSLLLS